MILSHRKVARKIAHPAYKCSQTPCECLEWMREPFHVGQGPQSMHPEIICCHAATQEFGQLPKFRADKYGGNGMMMDPSAHQQLMNVLKHLVYVWSGCGNHSMWVWGLNQCTLTSFVAMLLPRNLANSRNSGLTNMMVMFLWWIHLPINSL